jgi:periplasmic protein TonB
MFVPKFDIYNTEWLDLVFKGRNQSYGAYELRKHYTRTLFRSMGITAIILLAIFLVALSQSEPVQVSPTTSTQTTVTVNLNKEITTEKTHPQVASTRHQHNGGQPAVIAVQRGGNTINATTRQPIPQGAKPVIAGSQPVPITTMPTAVATQAAINDFPDVMPEPNGGTAALAGFLKQNLQYPDVAAAKGISGQVILSFVVETDGHLSDIHVTRSAGFGFDEEAVRVLKLAPAWQPGSQNGQPVRVRYSIPVNFRIVK